MGLQLESKLALRHGCRARPVTAPLRVGPSSLAEARGARARVSSLKPRRWPRHRILVLADLIAEGIDVAILFGTQLALTVNGLMNKGGSGLR